MSTMLPVTAGDQTFLVLSRNLIVSRLVLQRQSGTIIDLYLAKSAVVILFHSSSDLQAYGVRPSFFASSYSV